MQKKNQKIINSSINLWLYKIKGKPILEIRRRISEPELMKEIIYAAWKEKHIILFPVFLNRKIATSRLVELEIMEYDNEKNEFKFLI